MTNQPTDALHFDGPRQIEWGKLVPTDASDPDAFIVRADNKIAQDPEFGRWLRRHGIDERFVRRVEFSLPKLTATVFCASGTVAGDDPDVIIFDTKDGKPTLLPPTVLLIPTTGDFPLVVWEAMKRTKGEGA